MTKKQCGFTMVEAIIYMVVVALALSAIVTAWAAAMRNSQAPIDERQGIALATAMLEEIEAQPFTYCDPQDANFYTAASPAGCSGAAQRLGPSGETRGSSTTPYDNVEDYMNFSMSPPTDPSGVAYSGIQAGWTVASVVSAVTAGGITAASGNMVRIDVTATAPSGQSWTLTGYRARYAPNSL